MPWQTALKLNSKYALWRIGGLLVFVVITCVTIFMIYFIYQNAYVTLANTNIISTLNSNLSVDIIDGKAHTEAQQAIALKKEVYTFNPNLKYIFSYASSTTATSTAQTTKNK